MRKTGVVFAFTAQSCLLKDHQSMTPPHERYRQIFTRLLGESDAHTPAKREALYQKVRDMLRSAAAADPSLAIASELQALDDEYAALCDDPAAYFATPGMPEGPRPESEGRNAGPEPPPYIAPVTSPVAPEGAPKRQGRGPVLAALLLSGLALIASAEAMTCGFVVKRCAISAWVPAESGRSYVLRIPHGLNAIPSSVSIMFSPNESGSPAFPMDIAWTPQTTGNPVTVSVSETEVELHMFRNAPVRGAFDATTENWATYSKGYVRVRVER